MHQVLKTEEELIRVGSKRRLGLEKGLFGKPGGERKAQSLSTKNEVGGR